MTEHDAFTVMDLEAMERTGGWHLVRRSLGLEAFGLNVVHIGPRASIPEHDETERDQEEVFVVIEGRPSMVIDGQRHPAPTGTFARLDPQPWRAVVNDGDEPAAVLIASAPRTGGYEPMEWA